MMPLLFEVLFVVSLLPMLLAVLGGLSSLSSVRPF